MRHSVLGILTAPGAHAAAIRLIVSLRRWCLPRVVEQNPDEPKAWFALTPESPGIAKTRRDRKPLAIWVADRRSLEDAGDVIDRATVLVTDDPALGEATAKPLVVFPRDGLDVSLYIPLTPFVRARWRSKLGLPETIVTSIGRPGAPPPELVSTALALASAVAAQGRAMLEALAWGAPCATDLESAEAIGATDGVEVIVGEPDRLEALASEIAGDLRLAAKLARAGRRFVEQRYDSGAVAAEVAEALGLIPESTGAAGILASRLAELWTSPDSRLISRVREAVAALAVEDRPRVNG